MVDSVIFRVHDLLEHEQLVKYLEKIDSGKKAKLKVVEGEGFDSTREIYLRNYYSDLASGKSYDMGYNGFIRSSHYDAIFYVHYRKGYVEFNVSLPKYWFGTNTLQLIDHFYDAHAHAFRVNEWWKVKQFSFKRFAEIFNHFLDKTLGGLVKKEFVEIYRIDFCYNMVFNTESDAKLYLSELKKIERPRFAKTATKITNYKHGLYFPSDVFTFKIYHKGSEFLKHNFKKYKKQFGEEKAISVQKISDRILRYEIEIRKPMLTSIFHARLKEENPKIYKCIKFARQFAKAGYIVEDGIRYNMDGLSNSDQTFLKMSFDQRKALAVGQKIMAKRIRFLLRANEDFSLTNLHPSDIDSYEHLEKFSFFHFEACLMQFKKYFLHFQLGTFNQINAINYFIQAKNEEEFKKMVARDAGMTDYRINISFTKARYIYDLLHDNSWDEIKAKGYLPERTFRRYKKFFEERLNLKQHNSINDYKVDFTFANYYDAVLPVYTMLAPQVSFPS